MAATMAFVGGCAASAATASPTLAPLPVTATTTSTTISTITSAPGIRSGEVAGYAVAVRDGRTFDLQVGPSIQVVTLAHIAVPGATTCEGDLAKALLATIIIGHQVRMDEDGIVWRDDLDVAKALVSYGRAKAADGRYAEADRTSIDAVCVAASSTTRPARG